MSNVKFISFLKKNAAVPRARHGGVFFICRLWLRL